VWVWRATKYLSASSSIQPVDRKYLHALRCTQISSGTMALVALSVTFRPNGLRRQTTLGTRSIRLCLAAFLFGTAEYEVAFIPLLVPTSE
jgi:hypothetical protein